MRAWNAALIVAALGVAGFVLVSCVGARGNGNVTTEKRELPSFSSLSLSGSGTLRLKKGDFKVLVITDSNLQPAILTEVRGKTLYIGARPGVGPLWPTKLEYEVSLPSLDGIGVSGSANVDSEDFSGSALDLDMSGSGSIDGAFSYAKANMRVSGSGSLNTKGSFGSLECHLSGSGRARLSGLASSLIVGLSGSGSLDGREFSADTVEVRASGSGAAEIRAKESIEARMSGSGSLHYWGNPKVDARTSGSGQVERLGD
jgi:hypothetical protein